MTRPAWPRVDAIIPALNEREGLGLVLRALPREILRRTVVVDNGSVDGTGDVARELGADLVVERRRGYGSACLAGIARIRRLSPPPEILVFLDADFSDDPRDLPRLVEPIARGEADLVIGSRRLGRPEPGALPLQSRVGNALAAALIRICFGARVTDLGPFRAVGWEALERLRLADRGYGWTVEMQVKAARLGLRTLEIPVAYRRRVGRSKISGTLTGALGAGWKILYTIARIRVGG